MPCERCAPAPPVSGERGTMREPTPTPERPPTRRLPRVAWFPFLAVCMLVGIDLQRGRFGLLDLTLLFAVGLALALAYFASAE
jgi:hypothetical protein